MLHVSGLIPTRFLTMVSHLILAITILLAREENVRACLPLDHSEADFARKDVELTTGLGLAVGLLLIEMIGFFSGLSMFAPSTTIISIMTHATATVLLTHFCLDVWDCNLYWWIFGFCSALPAMVETLLMIGVLGMRKSY